MSDQLIFKTIPVIMAEIGPIAKSQENKQQGWKSRGIDQIYNSLHSILAKYKVFTVPKAMEKEQRDVVSRNGTAGIHCIIKYEFRFYAEDGSSFEAIVFGEAIDYGDKACNKAASIAHKYALLQVFCIPTKDIDDPDMESHDIEPTQKSFKSNLVTDKQLKRLFAIMKNKGWQESDVTKILRAKKIESKKDLTKDQYDKLIEHIEKNPKLQSN